jgi:hypothetical protein
MNLCKTKYDTNFDAPDAHFDKFGNKKKIVKTAYEPKKTNTVP